MLLRSARASSMAPATAAGSGGLGLRAAALRRGLSRGVNVGAKLTRKQTFKEHVFKLHQMDPERWTERTLSRHFMVPLENMQAMLALQTLEQAAADSPEGIDEELIEIASHMEEYLDDEVNTAVDGRMLSMALPQPPPEPPVALDRLDSEQESWLLSNAAGRLGGENAFDELLHSVPAADLLALHGELGGEVSESALAKAETEGVSIAERKAILQQLLKTIVPGVAPLLATQGQLDFGSLTDLPPAPASTPLPGEEDEAQEGEATSTLGSTLGRKVSGDDGVVQVGVLAQPGQASANMPKHAVVVHDLGPDAKNYFTPQQIDAFRRVRQVDPQYRLEKNLKEREWNADPANKQVKKTGTIVFAEVHKPKKGVTEVPRVWVAERAKGVVREPTEEEHMRAKLRVKGPALLPHIKRNYNAD